MIYQMYLANTNGQKLSATTNIEASTFNEARAIFRAKCDAKGVNRTGTEILAEIR